MELEPIPEEEELLAAKQAFAAMLLENELMVRVMVLVLSGSGVPADPEAVVKIHPFVMPDEAGRCRGGLQAGFRTVTGRSSKAEWHFIDLFTFDAETGEHTPSELVGRVRADVASTEELWQLWLMGLELLADQFGDRIAVDRHTGEIELTWNIPPDHLIALDLPPSSSG